MHTQFDIFPWNVNFQVGIPSIDEQHQKLVLLINKLAGSIAGGSGPLQCEIILDELKDYARFHFKAEEAIWHLYLPNDELETSHHVNHENFLTFVDQTRFDEKAASKNGTHGTHTKIIAFLINWLVFHILESDKYLAAVCLEVQAGKSPEQAKIVADHNLRNATSLLSEALLRMIGDLSELSFQLSFEISQRQKTQKELTRALSFNKSMISSMQDGLITLDRYGLIAEVNPAFCMMTGMSSRELVGTSPPYPFMPGYSQGDIEQVFERAWKENHYEFEANLQDKAGQPLPVIVSMFHIKEEDGQFVTFAATVKDNTERKDREEAQRKLALYDPLTNLPNRRLFYDQLSRTMDETLRSNKYFAIAYIDLDHFKTLNDQCGHAAGDLFLQEAAARIKECVRAMDMVARFGGDEFVALFNNLSPIEARKDAEQIAQKIRLKLAEPFPLPDNVQSKDLKVFQCSASIGVTIARGRIVERDELLNQADQAMYRGKTTGRNKVCFHESDE